jgi:hypothetical protein
MIKIYHKEGVWFKFTSWEFLVIAQIVFDEYAKESVIPWVTSACDGQHMDGSCHYTGLGWDFRIWGLENPKKTAEAIKIRAQEVDYHYDVVLERDHLHTEYDLNKVKEV